MLSIFNTDLGSYVFENESHNFMHGHFETNSIYCLGSHESPISDFNNLDES